MTIDRNNVTETKQFGVSKIINEHILDQAIEYYSRQNGKVEKKELIAKVKEEFDFTLAEYNEFMKRIEEKDQKAVNIATGEHGETVATRGDNVLFKSQDGKTTSVPRKHIRNECIWFEDAAQADQATGMLMYKSIPWQSRGMEDNQSYIQFDNAEQLDRAYGALSRRWDFIDQNPKKVAMIEFDNLDDYQRVVDFMIRQGMSVDFNADQNLDEDTVYMEKRAALKPVDKKKVKGPVKPPLKMENKKVLPRSFVAKPRKSFDESIEDLVEKKDNRVCKARRKWKPNN